MKLPDLENIAVIVIILLLFILLDKLKIFAGLNALEDLFKPKEPDPFTPMNPEIQAALEDEGFTPGGSTQSDLAKAERIKNLVVQPYRSLIKSWAAAADIAPELIASLIYRESEGNPDAIGLSFDWGLMQITQPALTEMNRLYKTEYVLSQMRFPELNIEVGTKYLSWTLSQFRDALDGIRAYKCGPAGASQNGSCGLSYANDIWRAALTLKKQKLF